MFNKNKGKDSDASTKDKLYQQFYEQFHRDKVWKKIQHFRLDNSPVISKKLPLKLKPDLQKKSYSKTGLLLFSLGAMTAIGISEVLRKCKL